MDERIERIKAKISAKNLTVSTPLSETDITQFEALHQLKLPEAYRAFLLHVGNGGKGPPHYGIPKLGEVATCAGTRVDAYMRECYEDLRFVREPFPLLEAWVWENEDDPDEAEMVAAQRHGHLYLGTEGCGLDWVLIVTGSERGFVWQNAGEGAQPTIPRRDFLTGYEDWLDGTESDGWWNLGELENTVPHANS